jgi:hypothetical protein
LVEVAYPPQPWVLLILACLRVTMVETLHMEEGERLF